MPRSKLANELAREMRLEARSIRARRIIRPMPGSWYLSADGKRIEFCPSGAEVYIEGYMMSVCQLAPKYPICHSCDQPKPPEGGFFCWKCRQAHRRCMRCGDAGWIICECEKGKRNWEIVRKGAEERQAEERERELSRAMDRDWAYALYLSANHPNGTEEEFERQWQAMGCKLPLSR